MSEVRRLLGRGRLVTLTGPGGVGKTRLAVETARQVRAYPDGIWLVELAAVADPELVASSIASVLALADQSMPSTVAVLLDYLRDKQMLLVLDNCEHLLDGCAVLVGKLLAAAPGLRVLATSRQPLRLEGEWVLSLPPLPVPDPESLPAGNLAEFEAVQLFVQRAQAVLPAFEVTAANRTTVASICRLVDGLPLAVELAAVWLRSLSAEQLLSRLDDQLRLLRTGCRAGSERQRTLQASLQWSYRLCSPQEQLMWARMSVFAGGFDLEAVERVCSGDGIDATEACDLVAGLVEKSLLNRQPEAGPTARYSMLEPVRQYGHQRLADSGELTVLIRRHREYYLDLARQADTEYLSQQQAQWMLRLRREHPNVRASIRSALAEPDSGGVALSIALAARDLWYGTGRYREGLHWMTRALAQAPKPTAMRGIALAEAGYMRLRLGDTADGERMLADARLLDERLRDPALHACVLHFDGAAALTARPPDLVRAAGLVEQGLAAAQACGDLRRVANSLLLLATVAAFTGDPRAAEYAGRCRALCESHAAEWTASWAATVLALVAWCAGDHARADVLAREGLPVIRLLRDSWGAGVCLAVLAWAASVAGRHERAARLLGACHALKCRDGAALAELGPFAAHHGRCTRDARNALGDAAFAAAFEEAARYTLDEATELALCVDHQAGVSPARLSSPARGLLTRREQQVAELVAEGLTNSDIAARLVVSRRTVESHVEHILVKLGFTSRAQVGRWIGERG
jgi:predicted ATPase/DNA-binding CsgD family transcriptional regulator